MDFFIISCLPGMSFFLHFRAVKPLIIIPEATYNQIIKRKQQTSERTQKPIDRNPLKPLKPSNPSKILHKCKKEDQNDKVQESICSRNDCHDVSHRLLKQHIKHRSSESGL
jgi:hypothetical protein